jgi:hypothetical protein
MGGKSVVDLVFCIDASASMRPCIFAVRKHVVDFLQGLQATRQHVDLRIDFLTHSCDISGGGFTSANVRRSNIDLLTALYRTPDPQSFFTTSLTEFQNRLEKIEAVGDEATLVALDIALDFPWRPRSQCHRVVICLTDEPLEAGAVVSLQVAKLPDLIEKIQDLGVMLFLVAPHSPAFEQLAEVDKSEYQVVEQTHDGLRTVDFAKVLAYIGKSVSMASLQSVGDRRVRRGLFEQASWVVNNMPIRGE